MYKKAEQSVYSINLLFNASKEGIEVGENYALELKQITSVSVPFWQMTMWISLSENPRSLRSWERTEAEKPR